jgi:hypothetical protein
MGMVLLYPDHTLPIPYPLPSLDGRISKWVWQEGAQNPPTNTTLRVTLLWWPNQYISHGPTPTLHPSIPLIKEDAHRREELGVTLPPCPGLTGIECSNHLVPSRFSCSMSIVPELWKRVLLVLFMWKRQQLPISSLQLIPSLQNISWAISNFEDKATTVLAICEVSSMASKHSSRGKVAQIIMFTTLHINFS